MVTKTDETADCETDRKLPKMLMLTAVLIIYIIQLWQLSVFKRWFYIIRKWDYPRSTWTQHIIICSVNSAWITPVFRLQAWEQIKEMTVQLSNFCEFLWLYQHYSECMLKPHKVSLSLSVWLCDVWCVMCSQRGGRSRLGRGWAAAFCRSLLFPSWVSMRWGCPQASPPHWANRSP